MKQVGVGNVAVDHAVDLCPKIGLRTLIVSRTAIPLLGLAWAVRIRRPILDSTEAANTTTVSRNAGTAFIYVIERSPTAESSVMSVKKHGFKPFAYIWRMRTR